MRDFLNNIQTVHLGNLAVSGTSTLKSGLVDTRGFDACTLVMINNTVTDAGAAAGYTGTVFHGDDTTDAGLAAVDAADMVNGTQTISVTSDSADDAVAGAVGYKGIKRYVGMNVVGTTGSDADVSVLAILHKGHRLPTTLIGTVAART